MAINIRYAILKQKVSISKKGLIKNYIWFILNIFTILTNFFTYFFKTHYTINLIVGVLFIFLTVLSFFILKKSKIELKETQKRYYNFYKIYDYKNYIKETRKKKIKKIKRYKIL
jgi:hypothetical protein